jgi:hypothetical protein
MANFTTPARWAESCAAASDEGTENLNEVAAINAACDARATEEIDAQTLARAMESRAKGLPDKTKKLAALKAVKAELLAISQGAATQFDRESFDLLQKHGLSTATKTADTALLLSRVSLACSRLKEDGRRLLSAARTAVGNMVAMREEYSKKVGSVARPPTCSHIAHPWPCSPLNPLPSTAFAAGGRDPCRAAGRRRAQVEPVQGQGRRHVRQEHRHDAQSRGHRVPVLLCVPQEAGQEMAQ